MVSVLRSAVLVTASAARLVPSAQPAHGHPRGQAEAGQHATQPMMATPTVPSQAVKSA